MKRKTWRAVVFIFIMWIPVFSTAQNIKQLKTKTKKTIKENVNNSKLGKQGSKGHEEDQTKTANEQQVLVDQDYLDFIKTKYFCINILEGTVESSSHLKAANELDYQNTIKFLNDKGWNFDQSYNSEKNRYNRILSFHERYSKKLESDIKPGIEWFVKKAKELRAENKLQAFEYADAAKQLSQSTTLIFPEDETLQSIYVEVKALYNEIGEEYFAKTYTSDFHKKNAGKIVFFNKETNVGEEELSSVKDQFKVGEEIYAIAYLKQSLKNIMGASNTVNLNIEVFIDESNALAYQTVVSKRELNEEKSYIILEILPNPNHNKQYGPQKIAKALSDISPSTHNVKIRVSGMEIGTNWNKRIIDGGFEIDLADGEGILLNLAQKYIVEETHSSELPEANMRNKVIEDSMEKALQNAGWESNKKIIKINIRSSEWYHYRHEITGEILSRALNTVVAFKLNNGDCKFWYITFEQSYNGSVYGETTVRSVGNSKKISCDYQ